MKQLSSGTGMNAMHEMLTILAALSWLTAFIVLFSKMSTGMGDVSFQTLLALTIAELVNSSMILWIHFQWNSLGLTDTVLACDLLTCVLVTSSLTYFVVRLRSNVFRSTDCFGDWQLMKQAIAKSKAGFKRKPKKAHWVVLYLLAAMIAIPVESCRRHRVLHPGLAYAETL
ncbi:MAG: uncharacterized protein KVP18_000026 [Porospora cf. gigantea A]|uniref:uncharacterized protein n=1 Tax=Porospora cf. gigantea A TaxID=2853593 RepID=UPI00355A1E9A|nr:MAG: hypothetical protein KVP18_000026 [Porospora cf. gigantea A]